MTDLDLDRPASDPEVADEVAGAQHDRRRRPTFRWPDTAMATRVAATAVGVSVVTLLAATIVGLDTGRDLSRELENQRLMALQASGEADLAAHMSRLVETGSVLASSPQAKVAVGAFTEAHRELLVEPPAGVTEADQAALIDDYQERYVEPLHAAGADVDLRDVIPENPAGIYLQVNYGLDGGPAGDRDAIDDADDGSRWSEVHATVHPVYRDIVDLLDLVDLFLIEPESGYVVYSVKKGPDLGTSLVAGPYSGSTLATIVDRSARESDNATVVGDLGFYLPALAEPVGFVASPVLDGDRLVGFLVLMYDSGPLNEILSAGGQWEDAGFPETGESLLFGGDSKVRTEPRSFIEDPAAHLSASVEAGLAESDLHVIRVTGTTVLTQSVAEPTLRAAIRGDDSVGERPNLLGIPTLSVVSAVPLPDLDWYVLSEVHLEVGERDLREFGELLVVGVALFVVILAFGVVGWAGRLVLPIRQISDELRSDSDGVVPLDVSASSPVEFHQLAESFESMANRIASQKARVATTRADRLALLRKMLPPAVAERIAAGETQTIDEIPQASVAVVVVEGLGDLVRRDATTASRGLVDRLLADLDDLARRHHLDRFNVVGDAYFAACGLNRPFIDHVPRAVSFVAEASIMVRELGEQSPVDLDVTAGIHTGSVMAGVTGSDRSVYDVWGETVTTAHYLARAAGRGHIVVSDEARAMLPDTIDVTPEPGFDGAEVWSVDIESTRGRP